MGSNKGSSDAFLYDYALVYSIVILLSIYTCRHTI